MFQIIAYVIICIIGYTLADDADIEQVMKELEVIPDVLTEAPKEFLKIEFENGLLADHGNELTPTQTKDVPKLDWTVEPDAYYTVIMSNPDIPSRADPKFREWLHWLVVNVPGTAVDQGELLLPYVGAATPKNSGLLRYVFLVFKQPKKLRFNEKVLSNTNVEGHENFVAQNFAAKYGLGTPVAGNVFQARWDEYVPTLHKMMGIAMLK